MPQTFYRGGDLSSVPDVLLDKLRAVDQRLSFFFVCSKNVCCLNSDANRNIDMINTCIHTYSLFKHDMT